MFAVIPFIKKEQKLHTFLIEYKNKNEDCEQPGLDNVAQNRENNKNRKNLNHHSYSKITKITANPLRMSQYIGAKNTKTRSFSMIQDYYYIIIIIERTIIIIINRSILINVVDYCYCCCFLNCQVFHCFHTNKK